MAKRKTVLQRQSSSSLSKRRKADDQLQKPVLSSLESLENDLIDIGQIDIDKLVSAGKSIFDSARRCLKGGKKRRVIQSDTREVEHAGVGWKVNFRTIMKHIRERNATEEKDSADNAPDSQMEVLRAHLESKIPIIDEKKAQSVSDIISTLQKNQAEESSSIPKFNLSESMIRKVWDTLSYTRCYPMNEGEMKELQEMEINKYIHYSLPKNEWYYGKFWFNKSRDDLINELKNRKKGRIGGSNAQPSKSLDSTDPKDVKKRESLAVLADLKQQILNSGLQAMLNKPNT